MSAVEENTDIVDLESDIDSMVSALETETPAAPDFNEIINTEKSSSEPNTKSTLKVREAILTGIDDLLISRGARLILFLPIVVVILFGLAQSYRSSDPDWWKGGVRELFLDLSFSKSVARAISSKNSERLPVASEISFCPWTKS